jgi:hypothetical protein
MWEPNLADVKRAIERLKRFAFVELTESWALSVCMHHWQFGSNATSPPINADFGNVRLTHSKEFLNQTHTPGDLTLDDRH